MSGDEALIQEFLTESRENLAEVDQLLEQLRQGASDEVLNNLFRSAHTVKGGCGFFGLEAMGKLTHSLEDMLMKLRDKVLQPSEDIVDILLEGMDLLRDMIEQDDFGESRMDRIQEIAGRLNDLSGGKSSEMAASISIPSSAWDGVADSDDVFAIYLDLKKARKKSGKESIKEGLKETGQVLHTFPEDVPEDAEQIWVLYQTVLSDSLISEAYDQPVENIVAMKQGAKSYPNLADKPASREAAPKTETPPSTPVKNSAAIPEAGEAPVAPPSGSTPPPPSAAPSVSTKVGAKAKKKDTQAQKAGAGNETVRVRVELLDNLMELVGEIVLGRNQLLLQFKDFENKSTLQAMAHMISDLQEAVMQTRMQPVGTTFTKFNRIVRDLARNVNKEINLTISGEEVELDRSIIESLSDPLTHLIRNCADHGIETPEERIAKGKDSAGNLFLRAIQEGGHVVIEVVDDGKGIDIDSVRNKALENGMITIEEAEKIGDTETANLIFLPGLSTANSITNISGRGVGMDVVKTRFEAVGGTVSLETSTKGTTVRVRLPLTLAIMPTMIVRVEEYCFAIPQIDIREVVRIRPGDGQQIENINKKDVFRLRGQLLPVISLATVLGIGKTFTHPETGEVLPDRRLKIGDRRDPSRKKEDRRNTPEERLFFVLRSGHNLFGLMVDEIDHSEKIVVKPLSNLLKTCVYYSGSAILGNGNVAMVLNTSGISEKAKLHFQDADGMQVDKRVQEEAEIEAIQERQSLLLFNNALDEQFAVPLSLVFKVERIHTSKIQKMSKREFVQLEGRNYLLVRLEDHLEVSPSSPDVDIINLIIPKVEGYHVGIVATNIIEAMEVRLDMDSPPITQVGLLGLTNIRDRVTYVLDLYGLFESISPERFKKNKSVEKKNRLLVVEDTPFFRNLEKQYFESAGYKVTLANNGKEALELLYKNAAVFDIIISDIVMPVMDGFELARKVKTHEKLKHLPIIALTGYTDENTKTQAFQAGFDAFESKMNKEEVLERIKDIVEPEV